MSVRVSLDAWDSLRARDFDEWQALSNASATSNPFLLPGFVQAAATWLTPTAPPVLMRVRREHGDELIGLCCVERRAPNLFVPLPHWRGYRHAHAFQSGWLAAPDAAALLARGIADHLQHRASPMRALLMHNLIGECAVNAALLDSIGNGLHWMRTRSFQRPILHVEPGVSPVPRMRASVLKDLRRRLRRLQDGGDVQTRILEGEQADRAAAERHLHLEDAGWKGEAGSSMLASHAQRDFFLEMAQRLQATGELVFVELLCDGKVIASTSNLLSGGVLSGFKTGWDPHFHKASPGRINEWRLFEAMSERWPALHGFDSQAQQDSYLAELLPDRQTMESGLLIGGSARRHWMRAARALRPLAYRLGHDE